MKRLFAGLGAAWTAVLLTASPAAAYDYICDDEPPVHVTTPGGTEVTFNNFLSAPVSYRHVLHKAVVFGYAEAAEGGGTDVTIVIFLPREHGGKVGIRSESQRFEVSTSTVGQWGDATVIHLHIPIE